MGQEVTPPLPPGFVLEDVPPLPPGFVLDGQASAPTAAPFASKGLLDFLPSPRTAFRTAGGMIGGAIGGAGATIAGTPIATVPGMAMGGTAGAAAGDALWQLLQRAKGSTDAPQTSQDAARGVTDAATMGAVQEAGGPIVAGLASKGLSASARESIGRILRPTTEGRKDTVMGIADDLAKEMPVSSSSSGLFAKMKDKLETASQKLEAAYNRVPASQQIDATPIKQGLIEKRAALTVQGEVTPGGSAAAKQLDELIDYFDRHPKFTLQELRQNRQLWDGIVNWWKAPLSKASPSDQVFETAANLTRETINSKFPKIADANKAVSRWKTAVDLFDSAETRAFGKEPLASVGNTMAAGLGAALGGSMGGYTGAAEGAVVGPALRVILQTPAFQSASLAVKQAALQAVQRGDVQRAIGLLGGQAVNAGTSVKVR